MDSADAAKAADRKTLQGSTDRFGFQWDHYSTLEPATREHLERWLGSTPLASFAGRSVLDGGCGMGRNAYWLADAGARRVLAVDVDERTVAAARRTLEPFEHATARQLSIYDLDPDDVGRFDRVVSIGVVHHLADPAMALRRLWDCVAPGGTLLVWVYGKEGNRLLLPLIQACRWLGSRLPERVTHALAVVLTAFIYPALRLLPFRTDYYRFLRTRTFRQLEVIVFDQMLPRIAHYWSRADLERLTAPLDGAVHLEFVQGNSWTVRVEKSRVEKRRVETSRVETRRVETTGDPAERDPDSPL